MALEQFAFTGNPIEERVTTSSTITRTVKHNGATVATLSAEPFNGSAVVRYDGVIRSLFSETKTALDTANGDAWLDGRLHTNVTINNTEYVFVRGVAQVGETKKASTFKFLTTLPKVYCYTGYEHTLCIAAYDGSDIHNLRVDGESYIENLETLSEEPGVLVIDPTDIHSYANTCTFDIYNAVSHAVVDSIKKENRNVPAHPFYVRWINNKGGFDYWMFSCDQKHTRNLTANEYRERYNGDGVMDTTNKAAQEVVEVSSGIVDAQTMRAIAAIPMSPVIEWYDESASRFVPVQMNSTSSEWMESQPSGEIVLSFLLPNIQINR